jgi:tripartite-type tricarboxylate transporter receptor subunit TctC
MKHILKLVLAGLIAGVVTVTAAASTKEISVILPNPAGSTTDMVFRILQKEYFDRTGVTLVPDYTPGGDMIIAANKFKNSTNNNVVLLGTTTIHIYNHVLKDSIPYTDEDFQHVAWVGRMPGLWITHPNSPYKTMTDVVKNLSSSNKPFIATHSQANLVNIVLLQQFNNLENVQPINYKGGPDVELAIMSNDADVALIGSTSSTAALHETNKIRIIGHTLDGNILLGKNNLKIPSVLPYIKGPQLNGGFIVSVKPTADAVFVNEFSKIINDILSSPKVQSDLQTHTVSVSTERGHNAVLKSVQDMRDGARTALKK